MNQLISDQRQSIIFNEFLLSRGLMDMWKHVEATNPGRDNAYHNTRHMQEVAQLSLDILRVTPEYLTMTAEERTFSEIVVVVAGMWHDYGHTAGRLTDAENIKIATAAFIDYLIAADAVEISAPSPLVQYSNDLLADRVSDVLFVTEFPFIYTPTSIEQRVVRDADLLYTFSNETCSILGGLYAEILPKLNGMSFTEFVQGQKAFHDSVVLYTLPGKAIHSQQAPRIIQAQSEYALHLSRFD